MFYAVIEIVQIDESSIGAVAEIKGLFSSEEEACKFASKYEPQYKRLKHSLSIQKIKPPSDWLERKSEPK